MSYKNEVIKNKILNIKYRMQIGFLIYIGLIMLCYGYNKFSKSTILQAQLSLLLQSTQVSWKNYVKEKLEKLIVSFRKTISTGKIRFLSYSKIRKVPSPHEINIRKGIEFFILWGRYIIMRKLGVLIKSYTDNYRSHPEQVLISMKNLTEKDKEEMRNPTYIGYYNKKSLSLFQ